MLSNKKFNYFFGIISFLLLVILDQVTKHIAVMKLKNQEAKILIDKVFQLRYLENRGAAFGILQGQRIVFLIITIVVMAIIVYIYAKAPFDSKFFKLRLILIFVSAGAIGNCIDRALNAYVVDFFYFNLIDFPIFNVADIYVTCAAICLVILIMFVYKDEDLTILINRLKNKKDDSSNG